MLNPKTQRNILIILFLLLLGGSGYLYKQYSDKQAELNISEQNKSALKDSVRTLKNKNEEIEYAKNILVSKKEDLKELNEELHEEVEKQKNKVHELNKVVAEIDSKNKKDPDTIETKNELVDHGDSTYSLKWEIDTNYNENNGLYLNGQSDFSLNRNDSILKVEPLKTKLFDHRIKFDLVSGLRSKDDDKVEFFVKSDHPGFKAKEIHSSIIDPETHPVMEKFTSKSNNNFGLGIQAGVGIGSGLKLGPYIGIGIQYNLVTF